MTVSAGIGIKIANKARDFAARLPNEQDTPAAVERLADALVDAVACANALDSTLATLHAIRAATDGLPTDHPAGVVREARDLHIRVKAMREIAPTIEGVDLDELREEIDDAIVKLRMASAQTWQKIAGANRVAGWSLVRCVPNSRDVGRCVRAMRRAGILPAEIPDDLPFGPAADPQAPEGSPASNSAFALDVLRAMTADTLADERRFLERATADANRAARAAITEGE